MKRLSQLVLLAAVTSGLVYLPACKEKAQAPKKGAKDDHDDHDDDNNNNANATATQTWVNTGGTDPCLTTGVPIGGMTSTFTGVNTGLGTGTLIGGLTATGTGTGIGLLGGVLGNLAGQATNLDQLGGGGLDQMDDEDDGFIDEEEGFDLMGEEGFNLTNTVTYEGSIKLLVTAKCLSCHSGTNDPNLSTFMALRDNANDSMLLIESDNMPRGNVAKLTPVEKQQFRDWISGGMQERDLVGTSTFTAVGTGTGTGIGGSTINNPCNTSVGTSIETGDNADAWTAFLNPPEVATCHGQGKLYDRGTKACHQAPIATSYQCTREGVIAKFQSLGLNVTTDLDNLASAGFEFDQCGEAGANDPIVMMYQRVDNGNELNLNLKKLCKNSSTLCL
jgi:hypothetical protein